MAIQAELQALLNSSAMAAPAGTSTQFVDPPNLNTSSFIVLGACISGAVLAVSMRMYTKFVLIGIVATEDCQLLGSAFSF